MKRPDGGIPPSGPFRFWRRIAGGAGIRESLSRECGTRRKRRRAKKDIGREKGDRGGKEENGAAAHSLGKTENSGLSDQEEGELSGRCGGKVFAERRIPPYCEPRRVMLMGLTPQMLQRYCNAMVTYGRLDERGGLSADKEKKRHVIRSNIGCLCRCQCLWGPFRHRRLCPEGIGISASPTGGSPFSRRRRAGLRRFAWPHPIWLSVPGRAPPPPWECGPHILCIRPFRFFPRRPGYRNGAWCPPHGRGC